MVSQLRQLKLKPTALTINYIHSRLNDALHVHISMHIYVYTTVPGCIYLMRQNFLTLSGKQL